MSAPYREKWVSDCGTVTLYLGDCLEILPTLEPGSVDAVVTDPPYGLGDKWKGGCWKTVAGRLWDGKTPKWDVTAASLQVAECLKTGTQHVIWGGNYFALSPSAGWLVWNKMQDHSGSECELAWSDLNQPVRRFDMSRVEAYCGKDRKFHPTQKPVELMAWCVVFTKGAVCDPMMGSGTTGVACVRLGRRFIGIELDPKYFAIAKRRIMDELRRVKFLEPTPKQTQRSLID